MQADFLLEAAPSVPLLRLSVSNPKLRSNMTVSSSVGVRPTFSCSRIRCGIISA